MHTPHHSTVISALIVAIAALLNTGCAGQRERSPQQLATSLPITVRFVDIAGAAGIRYRWYQPVKRPLNIQQTIGTGCGFLDYNNDGNLDILLIGPQIALYRGDGHGHFVDVTHQTGLDVLHGDFRGCAAGDYDNDGFEDLYLSAYRGGDLLHNCGGRRFIDVTAASGIKPQPWGTSCAFFDAGNDGKLDLFIGNYVDFDSAKDTGLCTDHSVLTACGPQHFAGLHGVLYHNLGRTGARQTSYDDTSHFVDVTHLWGLDKTNGKCLGVATATLDVSQRPYLYLANDEMPGDLLKPSGGVYQNIGTKSGTAFDFNGNKHAGMGVDWGDYDNDGHPDLIVTTYEAETKSIYRNLGNGLFEDWSGRLDIAAATRPFLGFGVKWIDADNDGYLDLLIANGHVEDNVAQVEPHGAYRQPVEFLKNYKGNHFDYDGRALADEAGRAIVGRGLAIGDFDNDGRVDALVVDSEGSPLLLQNQSHVGHWLEVSLIGVKSNRDGLGATVTVKGGDKLVHRQCTAAGSYLSSSDRRVHLGLGKMTLIDQLTIDWPSGRRDTYRNVVPDRIITLREGESRLIDGVAGDRPSTR